jgi:hypothetical protein
MNQKDSNDIQWEERSIFFRMLCGFVWFLPFCFVTNSLIGGVVGTRAWSQSGSQSDNYAAGAAVAGPAVQVFFQKWCVVIFLAQVLAYAALCLLRWIPGVGKYRKVKRAS